VQMIRHEAVRRNNKLFVVCGASNLRPYEFHNRSISETWLLRMTAER